MYIGYLSIGGVTANGAKNQLTHSGTGNINE
jgi:hypothetical protein